jgi:crotonobetainyl-CoA:carnitine CoA-transferase CaiB-like acyl-CoA transferase
LHELKILRKQRIIYGCKEEIVMRGLLEGTRVVELGMYVQGPVAGMMLAALGAEVVKIESPKTGDDIRGIPYAYGIKVIRPDGRNISWENFNCNKKSVTLDLHKEEGREVLYRLIRKSDVFITNLLPRGLTKLGCSYEALKEYNPKLIYGYAGGFGARGPGSVIPSQDVAGMARSGFMFNTPAADGSPLYYTGALCDIYSATMLCFGILAALINRDKAGKSQRVDVSLLSSMMWFQYQSIAFEANLGQPVPPFDRTKALNPLWNIYKCQDDQWIVLGIFHPDKAWPDFCEVVEREDLRLNPLFKTAESFAQHCEEIIRMLDGIFATKPYEEWAKALQKKGVIFTKINRIADLFTDPDVIANDYLVEFDNKLKFARFPFQLEGVQIPFQKQGAPELGRHTDEILTGICGCSPQEVEVLRAKGVL